MQCLSLVAKVLSNEEPNAESRLAIINENAIVSKIEKINKEDLDEDTKNTVNGILKLVHVIETKQSKNEIGK